MELNEFISTRSLPLKRAALAITGDHSAAEDVLQESLLKICRRWDRVRGANNPDAYAYRIVTNQALDWLRHNVRRAEIPWHHAEGSVVADPSAHVVEVLTIHTLVGRLPGRQRAALYYHYFLELPDAEAAQILRCRVSTVRSLRHRGLAALERALTAEDSHGSGKDV